MLIIRNLYELVVVILAGMLWGWPGALIAFVLVCIIAIIERIAMNKMSQLMRDFIGD